MYPHRIRLRGPWDCTPVEWLSVSDQPLPAPQRLTMPCRWSEVGWAGFTGIVLCRRRFGRPARLDPFEQVWLTFAGVGDSAEVWLNERFLGVIVDGPAEFPLNRDDLRERNELKVLVTTRSGDGGLWGEVALEIRWQPT